MNIRLVTLDLATPYMWDLSKFDNAIMWATVPSVLMADNKSMNHQVTYPVGAGNIPLKNIRGKNQVIWFLAGAPNDTINLIWW